MTGQYLSPAVPRPAGWLSRDSVPRTLLPLSAPGLLCPWWAVRQRTGWLAGDRGGGRGGGGGVRHVAEGTRLDYTMEELIMIIYVKLWIRLAEHWGLKTAVFMSIYLIV